MIASSRWAKAAALLFASGAVVAGVNVTTFVPDIAIKGAGAEMAARIGVSFADMSAGTLTALQGDEVIAPTPQVTDTPIAASSETPRDTATYAALTKPATPSVAPQKATVSEPVQPAPATAVVPDDYIAATAREDAAPGQSSRPKLRDPIRAAKAAPAQKPTVKTARATPNPQKAKQGNAKRNNTQGAASGTHTAKASTQSSTRKKSAQSGNAAASNYPGQVMRRIARVPKPNISSRGVAVVAFAISGGGGLVQVSVARSSGSAALDRAALGVIQKAAPFPAPPAGARRQFSIKIKGG